MKKNDMVTCVIPSVALTNGKNYKIIDVYQIKDGTKYYIIKDDDSDLRYWKENYIKLHFKLNQSTLYNQTVLKNLICHYEKELEIINYELKHYRKTSYKIHKVTESELITTRENIKLFIENLKNIIK